MTRSFVHVDSDGVTERWWPRRERRIPLALVDRFDVVQEAGSRGAIYDRLVLLLKDGSTVTLGLVEAADADENDTRAVALRLKNELATFR